MMDEAQTWEEILDPKLRAAVLAMADALGRNELVMLEVVDVGDGKWAVFKDVIVVGRQGKITHRSVQESPDYSSKADAEKYIKLQVYT